MQVPRETAPDTKTQRAPHQSDLSHQAGCGGPCGVVGTPPHPSWGGLMQGGAPRLAPDLAWELRR